MHYKPVGGGAMLSVIIRLKDCTLHCSATFTCVVYSPLYWVLVNMCGVFTIILGAGEHVWCIHHYIGCW